MMRCKFMVLLFATGAAFLHVFPSLAQQCRSLSPSIYNGEPRSIHHGLHDVNWEQADYGTFFEDASDPTCAGIASTQLYAKISNTLAKQGSNAYNGWLDGISVGHIFATALQLGGQGVLSLQLHKLLNLVRNQYDSPAHLINTNGRPVVPNTRDNEFDDYTVEAYAYAWIAAYYSKSSNSYHDVNKLDYINKAKGSLAKAFSTSDAICIYDLSSKSCVVGGALDLLSQPGYELRSFHHNQQNPAYGIGLMTVVAGAFVGLEVAGVDVSSDPTVITEPIRTIAPRLFIEGIEKSNSDGSWFLRSCSDSSGDFFDLHCGDQHLTNGVRSTYSPREFPLYEFYKRYNLLPERIDPARHQFEAFDPTLVDDQYPFNNTYSENTGKRVSWSVLAHDWVFPEGRAMLVGYPSQNAGLQPGQPRLFITNDKWNKTTFTHNDTFVLNVVGAPANSTVYIKWRKDGIPYSGRCGTNVWCDIGSTNIVGEWQLRGKFNALIAGDWEEQIRVGEIDSNVIQFVVRPEPRSSRIVSSTGSNTINIVMPTSEGIFEADLYGTPLAGNINAIIALADDNQTDWTGLACIVRFNSAGRIDVRNGSQYVESSVNYSANNTYLIRMTVDVDTHTYSVYVSAYNLSETLIASNFSFRSDQSTIRQLNREVLKAESGSLSVTNIRVYKTVLANKTINVVLKTPTEQNPPSRFAFEADLIPIPETNASQLSAAIALALNSQLNWEGFACIVRFNEAGQIDVRDGGVYRAVRALAYQSNRSYRVRIDVDISTHTYSVFIRPSGGEEQEIATNFAFRSEQSGVPRLDHWVLKSASGTLIAVDGRVIY